MAWLGQTPQHLREFWPRLRQERNIGRSGSALRRLVRRLGGACKRCRRSLRAQRDPLACAACQQHVAPLPQAEHRGQVAVYYGDAGRCCRQAPVPYTWQRRGQPPLELPAVRGSVGYSGLGFWQAGVAGQPP